MSVYTWRKQRKKDKTLKYASLGPWKERDLAMETMKTQVSEPPEKCPRGEMIQGPRSDQS